MLLEGKVVFVTGAAKGIGRTIACAFASEGADVAICDISAESMKDTQGRIEKCGRRALSLQADVTKPDDIEACFNKILDKFAKIDILINNAGITKDALLLKMSPEDWDAVMAVNLKGAFNCIKAAAKHMVKQRSGRIVNIASIIGLMGNAGQANYAASKAGIIGLTKTAAKELSKRNITVNAIAPGFIQTDMTAKLPEALKQKMLEAIPLARFGDAAEVAKTALFLSSDLSNYITGQVIQVDGGMLM